MIYTVFDLEGKITKVVNCPLNLIEAQLAIGENYIEGDCFTDLAYIPDTISPSITNKLINTTTIDKTSCLADGVDVITLTNIPSQAKVIIRGNGVSINQPITSPETVTFDLAGEYKITIEAFPYLPYEVTINAN